MLRSWVAVLACCAVVLLTIAVPAADEVILNGLVTDSDKKPIGAARVIAVPDQQRYWHPDEIVPLAETLAKANGEFKLSVPTTGPVALIGWSKSHRMTRFPVNPEAAGSRIIGLALDPGFTVTGTVTDAATGNPIANADVGPLVAGLDTETQRALRVLAQWTKTDAQGRFTLEGLASDIDHMFLVRAPGYVMHNAELSRGQEEIAVRLDTGGSSVSGEIFARGEPQTAFANTLVRANGNGFDVITRTDGQSRFHMDGLPGGTFSVEPIMLKGNRAGKVETVEMPRDNGSSISLEVSGGYQVSGVAIDAETSTPAAGVSIGLGEYMTSSTSDGSFTLGPFYEAQQLEIKVPEGSEWQLAELLTGNEYDAADGFSNVDTVVLRVRRQRLMEITLNNFDQTTAPVVVSLLGEKGKSIRATATTATFSMPVYAAGDYVVYATSGAMASEAKTLSVGLERSVPVNLTMLAGADVSGRLVVTNTDETTRVQTLRLALRAPSDTDAGPALFLNTSPRADGAFRMETMPLGEFVLSVSNRSGTSVTTRAVTLVPGLNDLGDIEWAAGNRLAGQVLSGSELPIPYARIGVLLPSGQVLQAETDEEGKFLFDDVYADVLTGLIAEAGSYALYREQNVALPQEQMKIVMQALGKLNVTVDAAAGTEWEVHIVRMSRWSAGTYADQIVGTSVIVQDAMGGETVEIGLAEKGTFRAIAKAKASGELRVSEGFDWAGEAATGESITLASGLSGRIAGAVSGADVPVEVTVINMAIPEQLGREKGERTVAVANGRFQATDLPPGSYLVLAQGETYSGYVLNVELRPGETATADLAAIEPTAIEGTIQLAGEPLPQATVQLVSETDPSFSPQTASSDAEGRFSFAGMLPDTYSLSATYKSESGELTTRKSVAVTRDAELPAISLDLTPPEPIVFTVDPGMDLEAGAEISLMNQETRQLTKARWVNGQLEAEVVPGNYELWTGDVVSGAAAVKDDGTGHIWKK